MKNNLQEIQKNYIYGKELLEAVSDADRHDELATMGRLMTIEEIQKVKEMVRLMEDHGVHLTIRRID